MVCQRSSLQIPTFPWSASGNYTSELRLPFSLDAVKLAETYPDLRKSMLVFEKGFDKLLKANEHIDALITGMVPTGARPTQPDVAVKEPAAKK